MTYKIAIIETLELVKEVEATSEEDALKWVKALYKAGEIVLNPGHCNIETSFKSLGVKDE